MNQDRYSTVRPDGIGRGFFVTGSFILQPTDGVAASSDVWFTWARLFELFVVVCTLLCAL